MTRLFAAVLLLATPVTGLAASPIQNGGNLGLGVGGGTGVNGLSVKYFVGSDFALQGVVGPWNTFELDPFSTGVAGNTGAFAFSVDALLESQPGINGQAADVAFNWGAGVAVVPSSGPFTGASGVAGVELDLEFIPVDVVLEYRPHVWFYPEVVIDWFGITGHVRIYPFPAGPK